ncbi:SDR family NAD(P)-dependent oxidoreductase [Xanthomonas sacchari]|uniref:SDR family NAD(P)-dependent oxidoreductase n=1 Tax=Xanthomonas sacchari TaxID=56458 RepID=UPI003529C926
MNDTIAILGAGPGLGIALARKYGRLGHTVALVARNAQPLQQYCRQLAAEGIGARAFVADLRDPHAVAATLQRIQSELGHVHTLYYGPNAPEAFVPAAALTVEAARDKVDLFLYGLIAAVRAVLPAMRARQGGEILVGLGGSASVGLPFMSGPGPALAGARNYAYSLHGELAGEGIYVGMLTLSAVIRHSGWHAGIQSGAIRMDLPPDFQIPEVEPAALADLLYDAAQSRRVAEIVYPPMAM